MDIKRINDWCSSAFAQIIIIAVLAFLVIAILIIITAPVLNSVLAAQPTIVTNKMDINNVSGGGVLGPAWINSTQVTLSNTVGSSYGILIIILLLLAVLAIIIVIGLFQYFIGGSGGRR